MLPSNERTDRGSNDDPHERRRRTGRPPLSLDRVSGLEARGAARRRPARVRDSSRGGLRARQAARHGLRDDHRSRHDRRRPRDRRSAGRLRLRGVDGFLPRRAAGRARALLRHHSRRPRVAAEALGERRGVRGLPARQRDRLRARPPLLRGRRSARGAPPPPARRAVRDLGDPQRLPRARAQHARGRLRRYPRRHRGRRVRRPCRRRHRQDLHAGPRLRRSRPSSSPI